MDTELYRALTRCETDVEGALRRMSGDEGLYMICLDAFLDDPTMDMLESSLTAGAWDDAFTAAHALKGLAGNMGFIPLFHAVGELVVLIRAGRLQELSASSRQVRSCYCDVASAIRSARGENAQHA